MSDFVSFFTHWINFKLIHIFPWYIKSINIFLKITFFNIKLNYNFKTWKNQANVTLAMVCVILIAPTILCALKHINTIYPKIYELLINFTIKKKGVLQLALQLNFWVVNTYNSLYLYIMSANGQVVWVVIHRIYSAIRCNSIAT